MKALREADNIRGTVDTHHPHFLRFPAARRNRFTFLEKVPIIDADKRELILKRPVYCGDGRGAGRVRHSLSGGCPNGR